MDLPFEPGPTQRLLDENVQYSGGVVVMASVVQMEGGQQAALVFRFATPEGGFYPPICLVLDPTRMAALSGLVEQAAQHALQAVAR